MNRRQVGFLKITESVEYFLPFVRSECGQKIQDFSFAHAESLRQGTPKDKRSGRFPSRPVARLPAASDQRAQGNKLTGVSGF